MLSDNAVARLLAGMALAMGMAVLAGWAFQVPGLRSLYFAWPPVKPNTAVALMAGVMAVWLLTLRSPYPWLPLVNLSRVLAGLMAGIGMVTLLEYAFEWDPGLDTWIFSNAVLSYDAASPGRMAPTTATSLLLLGTSLFIATWKRVRLSQGLVVLTLLVATIALLGTVYQISGRDYWSPYRPMALATVFALGLLSLSILFLESKSGLMACLTNQTAGGATARRLLPVALLAPLMIGWIVLWGQQRGYYGPGFGVVLSMALCMVTLSAMIWWNASMLSRSEAGRLQAQADLERANDQLEERVKARTQELVRYQEQLRSLSSELRRTEARERQRLATALHDNLAQTLAFCKLKLAGLQKRSDVPALGDILTGVDEALTYTRGLMSDLHPMMLGDEDDLAAAVQWVVSKVQRHGLQVIVYDDGKPKPLEKESLRITYQILQELLVNVLKHAQTREATVRLRRSRRTLHLWVRDRGHGFTGSLYPMPTPEGGFGLFNLREQIDQLGGRVTIRSRPQEGTLVTIRVPLLLTGSTDLSGQPSTPVTLKQAHPSPERNGVGRSSPKLEVLLVDDHRILREGLRSIIDGQPDLTVIAEASNGEIAIELAQDLHPDVVIMDVNMPTLNGVEATRRIRAILPDVTLIALSVQEEQQMVELMAQAGADAYLSKADAFDALSATIRTLRGSQRRTPA
jgi:signal transduction histidine kinase/ActR/RegA family two-component response regulator